MRQLSKWIAVVMLAGAFMPVQASPRVGKNVTKGPLTEEEKARDIISQADPNRIFQEEAYARKILAAAETLRAGADDPEILNALEYLMAVSHLALEETAKARALVDGIIARDSNNADAHFLAVLAFDIANPLIAIEALERAERMLTGKARKGFAEQLTQEIVNGIRQPFWLKDDFPNLRRSSRVLVKLGWPGEGLPAYASQLQVDLVDSALIAGNLAEAKDHAAQVKTIDGMLGMVVERKYQAVIGDDALDLIHRAIEAESATSAEMLAANPDDLKRILDRVQFLRSTGKEQEALALMQPKLEAILSGPPSNTDGFWLVNEAAYSLAALGRPADAAKLMQRLNAIPLKENPDLVSMSINSIDVITQTGDFAAAAAHAEKLASQKDIASAYGIMWMWSGAACAYSMAGQPEKAKPWLDKLKAGEKDNEAALNRALLCANDLDASAALTLRRLASDKAGDVLRTVQVYTLSRNMAANRLSVEERWGSVIARPDVKAAIEKKGKVLQLPLSRIYYGAY